MSVLVLRNGASTGTTSFALNGWTVLAISFFDDLELAVLLQSPSGERYLGTIEYISVDYEPVESTSNIADLIEAASHHVRPV